MSSDEGDRPEVRRAGSYRWARVSVDVLRDPNVSAQAKALYALLTTYANDAGRDTCYPRQETLAEQLGVSVDTVQRHIRALDDLGVIQVMPRYRADGGRVSNDYVLLDEIGTKPSGGSKGRTGAVSPHRTSQVAPSRTDAASRGTAPVPNTTSLNTPPAPEGEETLFGAVAATAPVDVDAEFVEFWKLYPKRVEKPHAARAYAKARRTAAREVIFAGLQAILPVWADTEKRFIPNPATWLNRGRWMDEVEQAAPADPVLPRPHQLERAPDGMTDAESQAWMRAQAAKAAQG